MPTITTTKNAVAKKLKELLVLGAYHLHDIFQKQVQLQSIATKRAQRQQDTTAEFSRASWKPNNIQQNSRSISTIQTWLVENHILLLYAAEIREFEHLAGTDTEHDLK